MRSPSKNGEPYQRRIGARLAAARAGERMTQADLGRAVGVTTATVARWEHGVGSIRLVNLRQLSVILALDLNWLLEGRG